MKHIIALFGIALLMMVSLCVTPPSPINNVTNFTNQVIFISEEGEIPREVCAARGIAGKVVAIHKTGCPACEVAIPRLEELETELGLDFEILNIAVVEDVERLKKLAVIPHLVPTVLIDCKAYIGVKSKEEYKTLIQAM